MAQISPQRAALNARAKQLDALITGKCETDFYTFVQESWSTVEPRRRFSDNWHIGAIAEACQAVVAGQIKNLGINVPPGTGKSTIVSVQLPAWIWIPRRVPMPRTGPDQRIMGATYDLKQAGDGQSKMRDLVQSEWYRARWPIELRSDRQSLMHYWTTAGGWRVGVAVSAPRMGVHPTLKIVDDPHNPRQQLLTETDVEKASAFYDLLTVRGAILSAPTILIMQRLHERDLCGWIREKDTLSTWEWLVLPMRWEPKRMVQLSTGWRDPRDPELPQVDRVKMRLGPLEVIGVGDGALLWPSEWPEEKVAATYPPGSWIEAAQAQQRPAPAGGLLFKRSQFPFIHALPTDVIGDVRSWDVAGTDVAEKTATSSRTAGLRLLRTAGGLYVIRDVMKGWWGAREVEINILQTAQLDGHAVPIYEEREGGSSGKAVIAARRGLLAGYAYYEYRLAGKGNKVQRSISLQAQAQGGNLRIYVPLLADGTPEPRALAMAEEFLAEIEMFPVGALKDQVDALTQAFTVLTSQHSTPLDIVSGDEALAARNLPEQAAAYLGEKGYTIPDVTADDVDGIEDLL